MLADLSFLIEHHSLLVPSRNPKCVPRKQNDLLRMCVLDLGSSDASNGTISEQLADYVTGMKIKDLPTDVIDKTKLCILDTIGCMLAGSQDRVGITSTAHALRHGPPGPCKIGRASCRERVYVLV